MFYSDAELFQPQNPCDLSELRWSVLLVCCGDTRQIPYDKYNFEKICFIFPLMSGSSAVSNTHSPK